MILNTSSTILDTLIRFCWTKRRWLFSLKFYIFGIATLSGFFKKYKLYFR
uniref:Uncharacterized protein n=1 Tax=Arundo donax TaxID=35708 RepID=A0A0A8Y767_ARUDO